MKFVISAIVYIVLYTNSVFAQVPKSSMGYIGCGVGFKNPYGSWGFFYGRNINSKIELKADDQRADTLCFNKGMFIYGIGIGSKSHLGNFGVTANYFLLNNFDIKFSAGLGVLNYNGVTVSVGPEYCRKIYKNFFGLIGCVYSFCGSTKADIETNTSDNPHYYIHSGAQYIRSQIGLGIRLKRNVFKLEGGYSSMINKPLYDVSGQWEPIYTQRLEKGISSGWSFSLIYQISW